ncbi:uncharacterized protein LOC126671349 [Mercurialis annua]|uniref:uncharacterized protein LOC126671349 n=1 Tax=Mercurialis annua TaxID=3986 RepID=UPI0021609DCE|nr:uncharacterized protein LOC126671349 [Mercurialis annua]
MLVKLRLSNNLPWCVLGDFNDLLLHEEKRGGVNGFREALFASGLEDLGAAGYKFTWSRGKDAGSKVEERLYRVCCNSELLEIFSEAHVRNKEMTTLDHLWAVEGDVQSKLKAVRDGLKVSNGNHGPNYKKKLSNINARMGRMQRRNDQAGINQFKALSSEYESILLEEEVYWKIRAKCHWLEEEDANTRFFHKRGKH